MKWIKKISQTPLDAIAKVIDSLTSGDNPVANAPSIRVVKSAITTLEGAISDLSTSITTALAGKVDKVTGKGLSTNDYTNADKTIVDGVTSSISSLNTAVANRTKVPNPNNKIYDSGVLPWPTDYTYTASQDCFVYASVVGNNGFMGAQSGDLTYLGMDFDGTLAFDVYLGGTFYLKKGQSVTLKKPYFIHVYGCL